MELSADVSMADLPPDVECISEYGDFASPMGKPAGSNAATPLTTRKDGAQASGTDKTGKATKDPYDTKATKVKDINEADDWEEVSRVDGKRGYLKCSKASSITTGCFGKWRKNFCWGKLGSKAQAMEALASAAIFRVRGHFACKLVRRSQHVPANVVEICSFFFATGWCL